MGREPGRQTSEHSLNPSWDATVHPVCETFNVVHVIDIMRVFRNHYIKCKVTAQLQVDAAEARSLLQVSK